MGILNSLFGSKTNTDQIKTMLENGAVVIDVRSAGEFQGGHVAGAKNIPLPSIKDRINDIKKLNKPIVLCCASGMRSGQATKTLKTEGIECENGGGWMTVNNLI